MWHSLVCRPLLSVILKAVVEQFKARTNSYGFTHADLVLGDDFLVLAALGLGIETKHHASILLAA